MKIKITEPGWEGFTGDLGTVQFVDGVPKHSISVAEAKALGAYIRVREVDEDGNVIGIVNPAHEILQVSHVSAPVHRPMRTLAEIKTEAEAKAAEAGEVDSENDAAPKVYSQEELEQIASDGGINALREIATPLGVRGTAIRTLIAEILVRQPAS